MLQWTFGGVRERVAVPHAAAVGHIFHIEQSATRDPGPEAAVT